MAQLSGHEVRNEAEGKLKKLRRTMTPSYLSAVPAGLVGLGTAKPNVETLGYYQASLRDEHEILLTWYGFFRGSWRHVGRRPGTSMKPWWRALLLASPAVQI